MRQQRTYSTEAIILKHANMGEADRILTLFTPGRGADSGTRTRRVAGTAPKAAGCESSGGRDLLVPRWKVRRRRGSGL